MIVLIICLLALIIGIGFFIYGHHVEDAKTPGTIGFILTVVGAFSTLIFGTICICTNCSLNANRVRIEVNDYIDSLNSTRAILEKQIDSSTYTVIDVASYNDQVRTYKTTIRTQQRALSNPWINWWSCYVYSEYSPDAVSYLYID